MPNECLCCFFVQIDLTDDYIVGTLFAGGDWKPVMIRLQVCSVCTNQCLYGPRLAVGLLNCSYPAVQALVQRTYVQTSPQVCSSQTYAKKHIPQPMHV